MSKHIPILLSFFLCTLFWQACTRRLEVSYPNTVSGNFEALWNIIDTKYCFVEDKQIDWDEVHIRYQKQLQGIETERELFDLLAAMLDELHDGHVNLYSPFDISRNSSWYDTYPTNYNASIVYSDLYLGKDYKMAGGLYYNRIANDEIGMIRYESFSSGFSSLNMLYVLDYFKDCKGLILDVRNNGGGDLDNAYKLAATFFTESRTVGYWNHKTGEGHYDYSEMQPIHVDTALTLARWTKPVVVLTNRRCYSATNTFVNCMRHADNCVIMGGITGGGGGMPMSYELPIGWTVRFSSVKMYDIEKQSIEEGLLPDIERNLLSTDRDDIIDAAITLLGG